jgi:hypothetical protein
MKRTYTRRSRAAANVLLLVFLGLLYLNASDGGLGVALTGLAITGPAIFYYGYFIASQQCANCRESIVVPYSSYEPVMVLFAVVTPFRVPLQCPHCNALTPWTREVQSNSDDAV